MKNFKIVIFVLMAVSSTMAVDGIAVAANYATGSSNLHVNGDDGDIVAYFIENSQVKSQKKLFQGEAREAVLSVDGKFVAFRKKKGTNKGIISMANISSGEIVDLYESDQLLNLGRIAWPILIH